MDFLGFVFYLFLFFAILCVLLMCVAYATRSYQDALLYMPDHPPGTSRVATPADYGIRHTQAIEITTADNVVIRGQLLNVNSGSSSGGKEAPLMIYFHGNAGNVGHRLPLGAAYVESLRCRVLMMDYRGYGSSDANRPTEIGLQLDAQATLDYAVSNVVKDASCPIYVFGTSLGGAVAVHLASKAKNQKHISGVLLENTFTSVSDMVDVLFTPLVIRYFPRAHGCMLPFMKYILKPLTLQIGWFSIDSIKPIPLPMLFLSGLQDELVPPSHVKALHDAAGAASYKRLVTFNDGHHNDLPNQSGYFDKTADFLRHVSQLAKGPGRTLGGGGVGVAVPTE